MTVQLERSNPATALTVNATYEALLSEKYEARIRRIERLGVKLFGVANCLVSLGDLSDRAYHGEHSMNALETMFCDGLAVPDEILVVKDATLDAKLALNRFVAGAPHIRFYAVHPILDASRNVIGCVSLIDYLPREFDDENRQIFADLLVMVERELLMLSMYKIQIGLIKQNRNLKRDSLIDPILGTWNKGAIVRSLRIEMERCNKAEKPLALLVVSLDQIAAILAAHGTAIGDMVLVKMISRIRSCIRPFDALGRFGNDVFLMVLPGASRLVATAVAERIRLTIMTNPEEIDEASLPLTISAGIVSTDTFPDAEPEILISYAEKALLSAKTAGNNRVVSAMVEQPDIII
jgi:diguanylate cyclase (GGDEF)-like protein